MKNYFIYLVVFVVLISGCFLWDQKPACKWDEVTHQCVTMNVAPYPADEHIPGPAFMAPKPSASASTSARK